MMVRQVLDQALETPPSGETESADVAEARAWLARVEALLGWVAGHPQMVQVNCEARTLLDRFGPAEES